jgi:hypothetical protein
MAGEEDLWALMGEAPVFHLATTCREPDALHSEKDGAVPESPGREALQAS